MKKLVAVEYNDDGTCKSVAIVKNIEDGEYDNLLNEATMSQDSQNRKLKEEVLDKLDKLSKDHVKVCGFLAKSIYDNLVNYGLIENDKLFQKWWYETMILGDTNVKIDYPEEYMNILRKVL